MPKLPLWIPTLFCAFLCVSRLIGGPAYGTVFFSFLPMSFFFVGMVALAQWKRVDALERRVVELQQRVVEATRSDPSKDRPGST